MAEMGKTIRGHEFHYSRFDCDRDARFAYRLCRGKGIEDGWDGLVEHNTLGRVPACSFLFLFRGSDSSRAARATRGA